MREKKTFCVYGCFSVSRFIKGGEKSHLKTQFDFQTQMFYKQPTLTKQWNIRILCKYYIVVSDTLVCSFLDVLFLLLAIILSGLHDKPRRNKDRVTEKTTQKNLSQGHHFFPCTPSFLCHFLFLSLSTTPTFQVTYLLNREQKLSQSKMFFSRLIGKHKVFVKNSSLQPCIREH